MLDTSSKILLVVTCSSTGQGELPPSATQFLENLPGKNLSHVDFIILCLGDSNYTTFMEAPHKLIQELLKVGAKLVYPLFEADDSNTEAFADETDKFVESTPEIIEKWVKGELSSVSPKYHQLSSTAQKSNQENVLEKVYDFIRNSSDAISTAKLSIPKMPKPKFFLSTETGNIPEIQDFGLIHNGQNFDPLNSPPYICSVASATRLTGRSGIGQQFSEICEID